MRQIGGPHFCKEREKCKSYSPYKAVCDIDSSEIALFPTFLTSLPTYSAILFDGFVNGKYIGSVAVLLGF